MIVLAAAVVVGWKLLSGLEPNRATKGRLVAYVGDRSCAECHAKQSNEWLGSHHQRAMQPATAETVLGDFNGVCHVRGQVLHYDIRHPGLG
ncbi:MAG: multiheme c-type cytochrome [Candidatus Rokubacteria bacterium]|nr:multiheme c-type cytochrome [Candidatus Rokubacteria bacterium]